MKQDRAPTPDSIERLGRGVLAVHVVAVPLAFSRETVEGFEFIKFLLLLATSLTLIALGSFRWRLRELRQPLVLAAMLFTLSATVSTIASASVNASLYGTHGQQAGLLTTWSLFILFLASRWLVRTPEQSRWLLRVLAFALVPLTVYGLIQVLRLDPLAWAGYSNIGSLNRPFATLGHPNILGAYLVLALPLVILSSRSWKLVLPVAMVVLIVLTLSRAAWLGLAVSGMTALLMLKPRRPIVLGIAVSAVAFLALPMVRERLQHALDDAGRLMIWSAAWHQFLDRPLLGWGPDTFGQIVGQFNDTRYWFANGGVTPARAHNELLQIAATQGIVGVLALVAGCGAVVVAMRQAFRRDRSLAVASAAALSGYAVTQLFGYSAIACSSLLAILLGMLSRLGEEAIAVRVESRTSPYQRWARVGVAVACLYLANLSIIEPLRASIASRDGRHDDAVRLCPREPAYWNRLAEAAEQTADAADRDDPTLYHRARDGYSQARSMHPHDAFFTCGFGRAEAALVRCQGGSPAAAYAAFDLAIKLDPGNPYNFVDASRAALRLADAEQARKYIEAGLKIHPDFGSMREQAATRLLLLNRPDEALAAYIWANEGQWPRFEEAQRMLKIHNEVFRRVHLMRQQSKPLAFIPKG